MSTRLIVWDTEVFKYDSLLGAVVLKDLNTVDSFIQSWDLAEQKQFYEDHKDDIWIGWNSNGYDDYILQDMVRGLTPFQTSQNIVKKKKHPWLSIKLYSYDLLNGILTPPSLKLTESFCGKSISTSEVDFELDRHLTDEEKLQTQIYNLMDLEQTHYNLKMFYKKFELRVSMLAEFKIPFQKGLTMTGTQIAASALKAKRNPALASLPVHAQWFPSLQIKNERIKDWYMSEKFRMGETLDLKICGTTVHIASGGAHSNTKKYYCKKGIYADISGFYNLIMINYDLLPRTLSEEGKRLYKFMYKEQLRLKKIDPAKRTIYKKVCLSVFGAMNNEYSDFYDPWQFSLVTCGGELLLWDLLEKLDGLVLAFNVNTDGVMLEPYNWDDEEKIMNIIHDWVERNQFEIKTGIVYDYYGRDVNCYIMKDSNGEIVFKGEDVKNYDTSDEAYGECEFFNCKEPPIIAKGLVAALIDGVMPETFVEQNKETLMWFMYNCKKSSFDYLTYDCSCPADGSSSSEEIQSPSRVFAKKGTSEIGIVRKHKNLLKHKQEKVSNLPPSVFVWNEEIISREAIDKIVPQIDYQYYVNRIYEKLARFVP